MFDVSLRLLHNSMKFIATCYFCQVEVASFLCDQMSGDDRHLCRESLKDIGTRSPQNICELLDVCPTMADTDSGDLIFTAKMTTLNETTQHGR